MLKLDGTEKNQGGDFTNINGSSPETVGGWDRNSVRRNENGFLLPLRTKKPSESLSTMEDEKTPPLPKKDPLVTGEYHFRRSTSRA